MGQTDTHTTTDQTSELCGACGGKGYQMNQVTGINEVCLICGGTGKKTPANPIVTWLINQSA
jgi:DnaJ-class molecular chaperone